MKGTAHNTSKRISGLAHIVQSLSRLLSTPIGSCVMLRDYGCYAFELIDSPANESNRLKLFAAITNAILLWEDRILPTKLSTDTSRAANGEFNIYIDAIVVKGLDDLPAGENITLTVPLLGG